MPPSLTMVRSSSVLRWRSRNDAGVRDLPTHGEINHAPEVSVKPGKQRVDRPGLHKVPTNRLVTWN